MSERLLTGLQRITCAQLRELMPTRLPGIYGLVDPAAPNVVRYVGSSTHIVKRLAAHASGYVPRNADGPKRAWLAELKKADRKPVAIVLELLDAPTASPRMHAAERRWIERFRAEEQADLNATLTAGERRYLRAEICKLQREVERLRAELSMQRATQAQRCSRVACCEEPKSATQHTVPLEGTVLRCTGSGLQGCELV